ncbi:MAG TPA: DUF72 domain-containing protein [Thermoleophilaceae bacterium]|nr:DUF72 domain-containing protein [Thermoleophilaceae bacterium]
MPGRILIGTSSWADPGFVKDWYPDGMPARDRLPWYAERFEGVELNSSFYAVPEPPTVRRWAEITPDGFTFDVKLHRLLSRHSAGLDSLPPDLRDDTTTTARGRVELTPALERRLVEETLTAIEPLDEAGKLGGLLLQLTPAFSPKRNELSELEPLVRAIQPHRLAIELRNRRWVDDERTADTLSWFSDNEVAFVNVDAPPGDATPIMPSELDAVTRDDFAYVRIHGRDTDGYLKGDSVAERFGWIYGDEELEEIAGRVGGLAEDAAEVHVFFNNNRDDDAPTAARRFRALLGQDPGPPPDDGQLKLA